MWLTAMMFEDGFGSFWFFRMIGERYRGILIGRRATAIGQVTTFFGDLQPNGTIRFANALFTSKRIMPFMGPGPIITLKTVQDKNRMIVKAEGVIKFEDGRTLNMRSTGVREFPSNYFDIMPQKNLREHIKAHGKVVKDAWEGTKKVHKMGDPPGLYLHGKKLLRRR